MPALSEASRVSFVYRHKLDYLVSDVPLLHCQGSRLRIRRRVPIPDAYAW